MFRKIIFALLALFTAAAFAAVDANKATQAELETIKGIGPGISGKILEARKAGAFKDWPDLVERVKGIGEGNAAKFSEAGLTVGGTSYKGAAPKAADAKPAKADAKAAADDKKAKAEEAKAAKAKAAEEKKAAKEKAKADAAAAAASKPAKK